jgi:hypothetical protein
MDPEMCDKRPAARPRVGRWLAAAGMATAIAGALPAHVQAKQVSAVVVCGTSGCRSLEGRPAFLNLFNVDLPPAHRPERIDRRRWFTVRVTIHEPRATWRAETWQTRFYPDAGMTHDHADGWREVPQSSLLAYVRAAAGIVPFGHTPRAPGLTRRPGEPWNQPAEPSAEADIRVHRSAWRSWQFWSSASVSGA